MRLLDLDDLFLQEVGDGATTVGGTSAGDVRIRWNRYKHLQVPQCSAQGVFDDPGLVDQSRVVRLTRALEQTGEEWSSSLEEVESLLYGFTAKAPYLDFAWIVEIINDVCVCGIGVIFSRKDEIASQHKMFGPDVMAWVEQTSMIC